MSEGSFYSIDRLVEFGLSLSVATQMIDSMNTSLNSMQIPGARAPMQPGSPAFQPSPIFVALEGRAAGPFSPSELTRLISEKQLTRETYVWKPGMTDWTLAENMPEVIRLAALTPPPLPKGEG